MSSSIFRRRGDTYPIRLTVVDSAGAPQDLSGKALTLTVSAIENPEDASDELFQLVGTITDTAAGEVEFPMTDEQANNVGGFFYDVEMTDAIPETFVWTPVNEGSDGDPFPYDGSVGPFSINRSGGTPAPTYQTRDARTVVRLAHTLTEQYDSIGIAHRGAEREREIFPMPGWEFELTFYSTDAGLFLQLTDDLYALGIFTEIDSRGASPSAFIFAQTEVAGVITDVTPGTQPDDAGWSDGDWYVIGVRFAADGLMYSQAKREADPDDWKQCHATYGWPAQFTPLYAPNIFIYYSWPNEPTALVDIWKWEWREL